MKLIPLSEIKDNDEFWKGTKFRQYRIGLNISDSEEDYYEYMLVEIPGEKNYMLLTCLTGHKSGSTLALVKTVDKTNKFVVSGKTIKYSVGVQNTYLVKE